MDAGLVNLLFLGFLILIFYFMLIRPQKRRVDEHRKLLASINDGDEVVTIGGMFGTVRRIGDDEIELEISPSTTVRVVKSAIARRVTEDLPSEVGDTGEEEESA